MIAHRLGLVLALGVAACDPADTDASPATPASKSRAPDRTEVTMLAAPQASEVPPPSPTTPPAAAPAVAAAPSDPAEDALIGGKQTPELEKSVGPIRPRLRVCYKKALNTENAVNGLVTIDAIVAKDGKVASARFVKRDGVSEDMTGCILTAVKAMTFDSEHKSQVITFTFGTGAPAAAAPPVADAGAAGKKP